jgi:hypothetical protein
MGSRPDGRKRGWFQRNKNLTRLVAIVILITVFLAFAAVNVKRCVTRGDLGIYYEGGHAILTDCNPYAGSRIGSGYLYPPFFAFLMVPFSVLPPFGGAAIWFLFNISSLILLFTISFYLVELPGVRMAPWLRGKLRALADGKLNWVLVLTVVITARFWLDNLQSGQINIHLWTLSLLGVYFVCVRKKPAGGALLGVAMATKMMTAPLLLFLLLRKEYRAIVIALGTIALLFVVPAVIVGWERNAEMVSAWYHTVIRPVCVEYYFYGDDYNTSLFSLVYTYGRLFDLYDPYVPLPSPGTFDYVKTAVTGLFLLPLAFFSVITARKAKTLSGPLNDKLVYLVLSLIILTGLLLQPLSWIPYFVAAVFPYMMVLYVLRNIKPAVRRVCYGLVGLSFVGIILSGSGDVLGVETRQLFYYYKSATWAVLLLYAVVVITLSHLLIGGRVPRSIERVPLAEDGEAVVYDGGA